ncbi:MAG: hypothetical protein M1838_003458, partial [Thelocarpon superellum]
NPPTARATGAQWLLDILLAMNSLELRVLKPTNSLVTLDLSQGDAVAEVLQDLTEGGWEVFKGATHVSSNSVKQNILANKV